jgi:hypothetical protein
VKEQDRRVASTEPFPVHVHAVALDEPIAVGLSCTHGCAYTSSAIKAAARAAPPVSTGR